MEQVQRRKMSKDKHTVPEERFTIDCSFCGFLTTERTYVAAMETAQRLKLRHKASDEKITIFDRLAQRGVCNTWDIDGRCIGYKEWREVPHEPVKGEQAGMLGVPGKVHTQKRPYEAGQMEFGSYTKYKKVMKEMGYEFDLHWATVAELKQMCSQRGLPTDGGKEDLIRRLK